MSVEVSVMEMEQQPQVECLLLFQLNHLKDCRRTKKVTSHWSVIDIERKLLENPRMKNTRLHIEESEINRQSMERRVR